MRIDSEDDITRSHEPWKSNPSRFCGTCHLGTYGEWLRHQLNSKIKEEADSCCKCHMPSRPLISNDPSAAQYTYTSHALAPVQEEVIVAIEIEEMESPPTGGVDLKILLYNQAAGHHLPTGDYGFKEVRLDVWWDDLGSSSNIHSERFFVEMNNSLAPGKNGPYIIHFDQAGEVLHARVIRVGRNGDALSVLGRMKSQRVNKDRGRV
jgi:hypothetical protein